MEYPSLKACLAALLAGSTALAQDARAPETAATTQTQEQAAPAASTEFVGQRLYLGVGLGFNSPSGAIGVEADFRVTPLFTVGLGYGVGLWGQKISPSVKLDWASSKQTSVFAELAFSANLGGKGSLPWANIEQEFIQDTLYSASLSVGGRYITSGPFFSGARLGYSVPLSAKTFRIVDGSEPASFINDYMNFANPRGLVVGIFGGMAF